MLPHPRDTDPWHARLATAGITVTGLEAKPWGMTEFTLTDPDHNHTRIGRSTED